MLAKIMLLTNTNHYTEDNFMTFTTAIHLYIIRGTEPLKLRLDVFVKDIILSFREQAHVNQSFKSQKLSHICVTFTHTI